MKKLILLFTLLIAGTTFAQNQEIDFNSKNSWLKIGLNTGLPVGDVDDFTSISVGLDLRGQYLVTPHFGIGVATGYNHLFGKDGVDDFGIVPLAGFARYYFKPKGLFIGADF